MGSEMGSMLTRRELVVQGSLALASCSPLLRALARQYATTSHCALGAYSTQPLGDLEREVGHRLEIQSKFVAWTEPFRPDPHRSTLIAWDGRRDLARISAGRWDAMLRRRARECREHRRRIYLRWAAEFNGEWNPCFGRPRQFVAAWRHIVRVFRAAGANNVRFVWCPFAAPGWRRYYPGDRFVDWVGMDGYNWGTARSWSRWQSFGEIFGPLYADYAGRKPLMICETGCAEVGGDKAAWIRDLGSELAGPFSKVRGLVWFDADKETDWRIGSSAGALAAFRWVIAGPRYS